MHCHTNLTQIELVAPLFGPTLVPGQNENDLTSLFILPSYLLELLSICFYLDMCLYTELD